LKTRFGLITWADPNEPVQLIGELAREAEGMGFSTLWIWDTPIYTKDAYVALSVAAQNTKIIKLGPGVSNPLTRHVSVTVDAIATLDDLSDGRAVLGYGRGAPGSANAVGFATVPMSQFREDVLTLTALLRGEQVTLQRDVKYRISAVKRTIPVFISAWGPRMLTIAGELTDGALIAGPSNKDVMANKINQLHNATGKAVRNGFATQAHVQLSISCSDNILQAIDEIRPVVSYQIRRAPSNWQEETPLDLQDEVARIRGLKAFGNSPGGKSDPKAMASDDLVRHVAIVGSINACKEKVSEIVALGPEEVTFRLPTDNRLEKLKILESLLSGI